MCGHVPRSTTHEGRPIELKMADPAVVGLKLYRPKGQGRIGKRGSGGGPFFLGGGGGKYYAFYI